MSPQPDLALSLALGVMYDGCLSIQWLWTQAKHPGFYCNEGPSRQLSAFAWKTLLTRWVGVGMGMLTCEMLVCTWLHTGLFTNCLRHHSFSERAGNRKKGGENESRRNGSKVYAKSIKGAMLKQPQHINNTEALGDAWALAGDCNHKLIKDVPAPA